MYDPDARELSKPPEGLGSPLSPSNKLAMDTSAKPTFVGVGAKKSASTWLSECLRQHPEIFMTNPKESHYFATGSGLDGYRKFFQGSAGYKAIGEFTPNYLPEADTVAERIRETLGEVKILAILRDPVKRYISHYKWFLGRLKMLDRDSFQKLDEGTFARANEANDNMLICGHYSAKLKIYTDLFGADNVRVLIYEEVFADPVSEIRKLYEFLEVDPTVVPPVVDRRVRQGYVPKYPVLERGRKNIYRFVKRYAPWSIETIRNLRLEDKLRDLNKQRAPFEVAPGVIEELGLYYQDEIARTRSFLGKELPQWGRKA